MAGVEGVGWGGQGMGVEGRNGENGISSENGATEFARHAASERFPQLGNLQLNADGLAKLARFNSRRKRFLIL